MKLSGHDWSGSAAALARAVERRARSGHLLTGAGLGLLAGAAAALALRWTGVASLAPSVLAVGALVGVVWGVVRARRVAPVGTGEAAWALDRLAGAHEQGLTAALLGPSALHPEVAPPAPPRVRLQAPRGLAWLGAGAVLATLVLVVPPGRASEAGDGTGTEGQEHVVGTVTGPLGGPTGKPSAAAQVEDRAADAERVRDALGLSAAESRDVTAVAERLSDPQALAAAREAARQAGSKPLQDALADQGPEAAAGLAQHLSAGARAAEVLEAQARADLARSAATLAPPLPPGRRATVERYFALRAAEGGTR